MTTEMEFIHLLRRYFLTQFYFVYHFARSTRQKKEKKERKGVSFEMAKTNKKKSTFGYFEPTPLLERGSTYGLLNHDYDSCMYKIGEGKIAVDSNSRLYPSYLYIR